MGTKLSKKQIEHYLNGGKFEAVYCPKDSDISEKNKLQIGKTLVVFQNCLICPIQDEKWNGQFRFNSHKIYGWFPEEDLDLATLEILEDEFVDFPEKVTLQHVYRMTYVSQAKVFETFGKGYKAPLVITREYPSDQDSYVLNELCNTKPCLLETRMVDLVNGIETQWTVLYKE